MKYTILFFFCTYAFNGFSQEIQLNEGPGIAQLFRNWTNANRANPRVEGWRIQILSSTERKQAEDARNNFKMRYPDIPAEWIHEKPYYKVRIGAFLTKQEAQAFLLNIEEIAGAYAVKDNAIHPRLFVE